MRTIMIAGSGFVFFIFLLMFFVGSGLCNENVIIKTGDAFPQIALNPPFHSEDSSYLGIAEKTRFLLSQVNADLILVEIMNINCGHCKQQAPVYNKLYTLIESSPQAKGRLKILAIGVGSSNKYIQQFRDKYKIPFPIIDDPELQVYDAVGKPGVPLTIFVRPMPRGKPSVVLGIHRGVNKDHEAIFQEMKSLVQIDLSDVLQDSGKTNADVSTVAPLLSEEATMKKIRDTFKNEEGFRGPIVKIKLDRYGIFYSFQLSDKGRPVRFFAKSVSQSPPCDQCHDVHFIYVFEETGRIRGLIPVQLTKYGNREWNQTDVNKIQNDLIGTAITDPMNFDEGVDAVSSATITSLVVYKNVYGGKGILDELKSAGTIK